jgi:phenylacetic acid degradation operon negative regulatory protein
MSASRKYQADDRSLTARSVLLSALLGTEPPELPVAQLVSIAALFGVGEGAARVALSRMASAGEVVAADGRYALAGRLLTRQDRQRESRHPTAARWNGTWLQVVVTAERRSAPERTAARTELRRARLAPLLATVWMRPTNLPVVLDDSVTASSERFVVSEVADAPALASNLWDLDAWAERASALRDRLDATRPALDAGDASVLAPGFVLSASVLRHFQADPLLPDELVPPRWPGDALRAEYDEWDAQYRHVLARYHHEVAGA